MRRCVTARSKKIIGELRNLTYSGTVDFGNFIVGKNREREELYCDIWGYKIVIPPVTVLYQDSLQNPVGNLDPATNTICSTRVCQCEVSQLSFTAAPNTMSQTPSTSASSCNFRTIFVATLKEMRER